jgi:two-component system, cell cycle response regulator
MELTVQDYLKGLALYAKGQSILYAEDEPTISTHVEHFLRKFFDDVRVTSNGLEAWHAYEQRPCDILVTDVMMPQMDGVELCQKITSANPHQKIIVISAYNESSHLTTLIDIGVDKFLHKPFDNRRFLRALYSISRELYESSEKERLQQQLKINLETTQKILDMLDDALLVVEYGQVVRANDTFFRLVGATDIESFNEAGGRIDKLFLNAKGYIAHCTNKELTEKLRVEPQKALVKDEEGTRVMLIRQKSLSRASQIIMLTDVTTMEKDVLNGRQKLLLNPFTGIPNKMAFVAKLQESLKQGDCSVVLATITNYSQMIKLHGKEYALEVERYFSESVKSMLETKGLQKSVFFANYDKKCFVLLGETKTVTAMATILAQKEFFYNYKRASEGSEVHTILLRVHTKTIPCTKDMASEEMVAAIDKAFETMSLE